MKLSIHNLSLRNEHLLTLPENQQNLEVETVDISSDDHFKDSSEEGSEDDIYADEGYASEDYNDDNRYINDDDEMIYDETEVRESRIATEAVPAVSALEDTLASEIQLLSHLRVELDKLLEAEKQMPEQDTRVELLERVFNQATQLHTDFSIETLKDEGGQPQPFMSDQEIALLVRTHKLKNR